MKDFYNYFSNNKFIFAQSRAKGREGCTTCTAGPPMLKNSKVLNTKHNARKIAIAIEITISLKIKFILPFITISC